MDYNGINCIKNLDLL